MYRIRRGKGGVDIWPTPKKKIYKEKEKLVVNDEPEGIIQLHVVGGRLYANSNVKWWYWDGNKYVECDPENLGGNNV